jgi:hypothetical protein
MAAARRPKGEGTAPKLQADGRWRAELTLGTDANGKRDRKVVYGATKTECSADLRAVIKAKDDGTLANGKPPP